MSSSHSFTEARDFLLRHREDPVTACRDFRWPVLERFNWALDHFDVMARENDALALHIVSEDGGERKLSFKEMSQRSAQVANHLRSLGVQRGDRVLLMLGNELPLWEAMLACMKLGAVLIPATALLTTDDLRDRIERGQVRSYPVGHLSTMYWIGLEPGDVHLNISSPGWAKHAWSCFFAPWNAGACVFIHNTARFNAKALLEVLAKHGVSSLCAPPTVWRMLIQEDLAAWRGRLQLREVVGAGEPLNPEIIEQVRAAWGLTLRDGYGQTETTAQVGNTPGQPVKPGSMGRPLPGYRIALLDADDKPAEEGEVCIDLAHRPTGLMAGYEDGGAHAADAMRGGYYHTGDVAIRDVDGTITFVGRADDVFKASDYRISPFELESALIEHAAVAEVAVVPCPDPLRLAVPKAYVTLTAGAEAGPALAEALFVFCRSQLAPYKRVRRIEFVDELPKTISGKIRRVQLRGQELDRQAAGARGEREFLEEDFPSLRSAG